jgi:hypothetical protein
MPNTEVIITPTITITPQWRQHNRSIWVADLSEYANQIDKEFPQLFANKDSMVEARYPNMGASMSTIMDYKRDVAQSGTNKNTIVAKGNIPSNITGAKLVIWPGETGLWGWAAFVLPVRSVNRRTINLDVELTMNENSFTDIGGDTETPHPGNPFYVTGALTLLDAPGEYYFDKQTNNLYFYPPWNGRPDTHVLTMRSNFNTAILAEDTSHVNIRNIAIYGGGINMRNTRNNTIENCRVNYAEHFYLSGWWRADYDKISAMVVTGANIRISGCEFGLTAGSGIILGGENNLFTNNIVHNVGYSGNEYGGVFLLQSKNIEISHNTFRNSASRHITFYHNNNERCVIRNNYMENHSILLSDAGALHTNIYSNGGNTEIYNNFIVCGNKGDDNGAMTKIRIGLYIDSHSSNYNVHHNIVIGGSDGLCANLANKGTRFYNNTVIGADCGMGFMGLPVDNADARDITFTDNLFVNIKNHDIIYNGWENNKFVQYRGNFTNGTVPVTQNPERRMISSGNARGTVDTQYRPTGRTPDIGAVPRNGTIFLYGADWNIGDK